MISLSLGQIVNAESVLGKLNKLSTEEKLEFKLAYKIAKIIKKITPELEDFYAQRNKILQKYGVEIMTSKKDEGTGEDIMIGSGNWEIKDSANFKRFIEILIALPVELENVFPFKENDFEELKGLSTEDVILLEPFMDTPTEAPSARKKIEISFDDEVIA